MTKIFISDLTHTANGISAQTFPLGASYVASYAKKMMGDRCEIDLFRFPDKLSNAIASELPRVACFSNYSWNFELSYRFAKYLKSVDPTITTVFGGPNFPIMEKEQFDYLSMRNHIDFYIQNEGEVALASLLEELEQKNYDAAVLKSSKTVISNCVYLSGDQLISGKVDRIMDVNEIPSPYLTGLLDEFFDSPLLPMLETTRGCPFSCAFCADGLSTKNKITRYIPARVEAELKYIAERVKFSDELIITDLNFGMYKNDLETAQFINQIQKDKNWPVVVSGSGGKNKPERVIETAKILNGTWSIGSAIQSSDAQVLKNIKRSNISLDAYNQFIQYVNGLDTEAESYTEVILGLPGDSLKTHFNSLRTGIDNGVKTVRAYQAILLAGTDLASASMRSQFEMTTKYRLVPGSAGVYDVNGTQVPAAEFEEIIIQTKDMSFNDYLSCRKMHLLIEIYFNKGMFEEFFATLEQFGLLAFDILVHLHSSEDKYPNKVSEIIKSFVYATTQDLFDTWDETQDIMKTADTLNSYFEQDNGRNELLEHRALLYLEFETIAELLLDASKELLSDTNTSDPETMEILEDLIRFIVFKKKDIRQYENSEKVEFRYDVTKIDGSAVSVSMVKEIKETGLTAVEFFHTEKQKRHIHKVLDLYQHHSGGFSKMLQNNNMRKMYRTTTAQSI